MTLEMAEKIPGAAFTDITENPEKAAPENTGQVLDIGAKAETTDIFSTPETPNARTQQTPADMFPNAGPNGVKLGNAIGGKTAVEIMNVLLPSLAVYAIGAMGYRADKRMIELTADEKKIVIPAMQDYLNTIDINFQNPLYNLLFVVGSVYAAKVIDIMPGLQKVQGTSKPQQTAATGARQTPKSAADALIQKTAASRKTSKDKAIQFLIKEGEIIRSETGYKLA